MCKMMRTMRQWLEDWALRRECAKAGVVLADATESSPAIQYVNLLLFDAVTKGQRGLTLSPTQLLPAPEHWDDGVPIPQTDKLINRLKVMCGINPIHTSSTITGTCQMTVGREEYQFHCEFNDECEPPCAVRIENNPDRTTSP